MRTARAVSVIGTTLVVLSALTACSGDAPDAAPTTSADPTPLAEIETGSVTVARDGFCERVAPAAIEAALGAEPTDARSWANGQRARLAPGVTDVAHEYGCSWSSGGTTARAWVFAPPVTPQQAEGLRRAAARVHGCEPVPSAPDFGRHDAALRCSGDPGPAVVTAFHGLFGDAWLSCSVQGAGGADLLDRTEQWCATVLRAASA